MRTKPRQPLQNIEGVDIPLSIRAFERDTIRYVEPPSSSLSWAGAEWEHPVSMDFKTKSMDARLLGAYHVQACDEPTPANRYLEQVKHGFARAAASVCMLLAREGMVLDAGGLMVSARTQGMFVKDGEVLYRFEARAWPAIAGVTTPPVDTTI